MTSFPPTLFPVNFHLSFQRRPPLVTLFQFEQFNLLSFQRICSSFLNYAGRGSAFPLVRSLAIYFRLLVFPLRRDDFAAVSSKLEKQFLFSSPKISFVSAAHSSHYIYPTMKTVTTVGYHALFRQLHLDGALLIPTLRNTNHQADMSSIQVNLYCLRQKKILTHTDMLMFM